MKNIQTFGRAKSVDLVNLESVLLSKKSRKQGEEKKRQPEAMEWKEIYLASGWDWFLYHKAKCKCVFLCASD